MNATAAISATTGRPIAGGTGRFSTDRGEADQELLGFNNPNVSTMRINKIVALEILRR
jgi:hypothetical protein